MKKTVLVTGGSRGIGLAMVRKFREAGYAVAACSTSEKSAAASGADLHFACDVSDPAQVKKAVATIQAKFGKLDVLINNAGAVGEDQMDPGQSDENWHRVIDVNLHGTYYMCKYALPLMPDGAGRILNIASILALRGVPDQIAYCAAKHGVLGFTRALAHFAAPRRITANTICPGFTRTDMGVGRMKELNVTEESLKSFVPLGRIVEPEEVAAMALYLASPEAAAVTGQAFTIDGGAMA